MIQQCFTLLLALLFADVYTVDMNKWVIAKGPISLPNNAGTLKDVTVKTLTLPEELHGNLNQHSFSVDLGSKCLVISGSAKMKLITLPATVQLCGAATFDRVCISDSDTCHSQYYEVSSTTPCTLRSSVGMGVIQMSQDLCTMLPEVVVNYTEMVPIYPAFEEGSSPVTDFRLFKAIDQISRGIQNLPVDVAVSFPSETAVRFNITVLQKIQIDLNKTTANMFNGDAFPSLISNALTTLSGRSPVLANVMDAFSGFTVKNGPAAGSMMLDAFIPAGLSIQFDLLFSDFQCNPSGFRCTFPEEDGFRVGNMAIKGLSDFDMFFSHFSSSVEDAIQAALVTNVFPLICSNNTGRCTFFIPSTAPTIVPPIWLMVVMPVVAITATVLIVAFNLRRHRRTPLVNHDGSRVSEWRIIVEDSALCMVIFGCMACFITSNITSAATVVIGGEVTSYAFGLINTVSDLWKAGLQPLSFFVMVFSGIYPYFKLLCMLLYTVLLYRPDSMVLKIIDVIGKFSFLDMFVMLIFVSGLEIPGVADVNILASFYLFMGATTFSIACGNYATHLWRRGTSVRELPPAALQRSGSSSSNALSSPSHAPCSPQHGRQMTESDVDPMSPLKIGGSAVAEQGNIFMRFLHRVWWLVSIPAFLLVLGLTLPCIATTTLSYRVGGVASIIAPPSDFTLITLSNAPGIPSLLLGLVTVIAAPLLCSLFYEETAFIGAWTAGDVMLLACIAGLLQLNQFVQFILGGDFDAVYNAHAQLHWPLIPLLIASLVIWALQIAYFIGVRKRWFK